MTSARTNVALAERQMSDFDRVTGTQVPNRNKLNEAGDDARMLIMTEEGRVKPLFDSLMDKKKTLDNECQYHTDKAKDLLDFINKLDAAQGFQTQVNQRLQSGPGLEARTKALQAIRQHCWDFASRGGLAAGGGPHECRFEPVDASEVETLLQERLGASDTGYTSQQVQEEFSSLMQSLHEAQKDAADKENKISELQASRETLMGKLTSTEKSAAESAKAADDREASLQAEKDGLTSSLNQLVNLKNQHQSQINELRDVKNQLSAKETESDDLRQKYDDLEKQHAILRGSSSTNAQAVADTKRELQQTQDKLQEITEQRDTLETNLASEQTKVAILESSSTSRVDFETVEVQRDDLLVKIREAEKKFSEARDSWAQSLSSILSANVTGTDVAEEIVQPLLKNFSSNFSDIEVFDLTAVTRFRFAEAFVGVEVAVRTTDLTLIELLSWAHKARTPPGLPTHPHLAQLVWLDRHLLESIHTRAREGAYVLLAMHLVFSRASNSSDWIGRSMAYVQLAGLVRQYRMRDRQAWAGMMTTLVTNHPRLAIDLVGQACLMHLAFTTDDAKSCMAGISANADEVFEHVDQNMDIPDIISILGGHDARFERVSQSGQTFVFVHMDGGEEIVFVKQGMQAWICSVRKLEIRAVGDARWQVQWGETEDQVVEVQVQPPNTLHDWMKRYHSMELWLTLNDRIRPDPSQFDLAMSLPDVP